MGRKRNKPFDRAKDRTTYFRGILYEEDASHLAFITKIKNGEIDGYIIKHDKEENKTHYHFLAHTDNGMTISAFAKSQGIKANLVQQIDDEEATIAYFEHADNASKEAGKKPYKLEDGEGNLKQYLVDMRTKMKQRLKRISTYEEAGTMANFVAWLDEQTDYVQVKTVVNMALEGKWYDVLRRNWSIIGSLCREHNDTLNAQNAYVEQVAGEISERLCDAWTRATGIKTMLCEMGVSKQAVEQYTRDQMAYDASIKLMNEQLQDMLRSNKS